MTIAQIPILKRSLTGRRASLALLALFIFAIFLSASLLFTLEPLFAKLALPLLGGAPAVWSVAMVFFQTLMLAGYAYAHVLTHSLSTRLATIIHAGVLALAGTSLPVTLRLTEDPPAEGDPTWWLVRCLSMSIGLPFFALAAQGPLLQAWFARSGHEQAKDPYFLYAASNIGSFVALLAYPFILEPLIGLRVQSATLTWLFLVCALSVIAAGLLSRNKGAMPTAETRSAAMSAGQTPSFRTRVAWLTWSFIPSALLVSVTTHISTDVAAAPLLWVVPLGLYLLSFVIVFRNPSPIRGTFLRMLAPVGATMALISIGLPSGNLLVGMIMHLGAFFCIALACGRSLYDHRPDARQLTGFYAIMSFGGALGGLFSGLIAPQIFNSIVEYPVLLFSALLVAPGSISNLKSSGQRDVAIAASIMLSCLIIGHVIFQQSGNTMVASRIAFGGIGVIMLLRWRDHITVTFGGALLAAQLTMLPPIGESGESLRSFFGVSKIVESRSGEYRALVHGTTMHGAMRIRTENGDPVVGLPTPTTYYHAKGPIASALRGARVQNGGLDQISVVGLGAGAMACHVQRGETITYYEIDPTVVRLATDPKRFRFLSECTPEAKIVLGDARITLAHQQKLSQFILIDAFSSDAIPVHLLTLEALKLYFSKLAPGGMITFHTSNNHMDFAALIGRLALEIGVVAYENRDVAIETNPDLRMATTAVSLVREARDAEALLNDNPGWSRIDVGRDKTLWTDDFSSILFPLIARWRR